MIKVQIPKEEYEKLKDQNLKIIALEITGVDNWSGYSYAMEVLEDLKSD